MIVRDAVGGFVQMAWVGRCCLPSGSEKGLLYKVYSFRLIVQARLVLYYAAEGRQAKREPVDRRGQGEVLVEAEGGLGKG